MVETCWILESKKKGTKQKFKNAGAYTFKRKSDFGSLAVLRRRNPELDLKLKRVKCSKKL